MYPKGGRNSCVSCQIHILLTSRAYPYYGPRIFCTEEGFNFRSRHKIKLVGGFQGFLVYSNYSGCRRSGGGGSEANGPHLWGRLPQNLYLKLSGGGIFGTLVSTTPPSKVQRGQKRPRNEIFSIEVTQHYTCFTHRRGVPPRIQPLAATDIFSGGYIKLSC